MLRFKKIMNISMKDEMMIDRKGGDLINLGMLETPVTHPLTIPFHGKI